MVEFYYGDNLIGIWETPLNPLGFALLEEYRNTPKWTDDCYNKKYLIKDIELFFNKACCNYYNLDKIWSKSNIIEEILYFTKCSNLDDAKKQFHEVEKEIKRKTSIEIFNDNIGQLYKMYQHYKKKEINNDNNTFWFRYVKD